MSIYNSVEKAIGHKMYANLNAWDLACNGIYSKKRRRDRVEIAWTPIQSCFEGE